MVATTVTKKPASWGCSGQTLVVQPLAQAPTPAAVPIKVAMSVIFQVRMESLFQLPVVYSEEAVSRLPRPTYKSTRRANGNCSNSPKFDTLGATASQRLPMADVLCRIPSLWAPREWRVAGRRYLQKRMV